MTAKMVAMSVGMSSSLLIGTLIGVLFPKSLAPSTMISIVLSMLLAFLIGKPFGTHAILEAITSGIMGSAMGAMLGNMLQPNEVSGMLLFLDALYIICMATVVFIVNRDKDSGFRLNKQSYSFISSIIVPLIILVAVNFFNTSLDMSSVGNNGSMQHHDLRMNGSK